MVSTIEIQHWTTVVPDYMATAAVLLVAVVMTAGCGLVRRRQAWWQWLPATLFVGLSAVAMWPLSTIGTWWWTGLTLGGAGFVLMLHLGRETTLGEVKATPAKGGLLYLLLAVGIAALLLFHDLGGYSGNLLLGWEATVIHGFADAFLRGESVLHFALQRFLWDDGILSAGNTSLFYGAPTYALFHFAGFSPWTMRCAAAIATLASVVIGYLWARHFFGTLVAGAVAMLLALNPAVLFYGRYGSSPAGTMAAVLLAVSATYLFLERNRSAWWRALLCAAALYIATVQYSPGRIVVLTLLAFIPIALALQWRQLGWQRPLGVVLIAAVAVGVWQLESAFDRQGYFLRARGEQFFELIKGPDYINALYGAQLVPPHLRSGVFTFTDKVELLGRALLITVPQYLKLMLPALAPPARGAIMTFDPPPLQLYYGPAVLFIVWGLGHSLRRWRSWPYLCLLMWVAAGTVPLLLTNRIDSHRIMLFVIPLACWAAFGVWEAAQAMTAARVPSGVQHVLALALILTGTYSAVNVIYYEHTPESPAARAIVAELATVPGPVLIGVEGLQREVGWAGLQLLERTRKNPQRISWLINEGVVHGLQSTQGAALEGVVRQLRRAAAGATLLFLPAGNFRLAAATLAAMGLRVTERGLPEFHVLRADEGAQETGLASEQIEALPTPVIRPSPTPPKPIILRAGPKQWLTDFQPLEVKFSFMPPKVDRTWNDSPLQMGGIEYAHGIGMHSSCRVTYPVPANATAFQAIVGLSDGVRDCDAAGVTFEVRNDKDQLLYDSGFVDNSVPPQPVDVPLHDTKTITLVVTDGGNGPDCDHADWALAAFMLAPE